MQRSDIRLLQGQLQKAGLYTGDIDGLVGSGTEAAVHKALLKRTDKLPPDWSGWEGKRKMVALVQLACHERGIDAGKVDGWYGPTTEFAADQLRVLIQRGELPRPFVDLRPIVANPHNFPNQRDMEGFYGRVCEVQTVAVTCPWTLTLDWEPFSTTNRISIHTKLADSLATVLEKTLDHYGLDGIKHLGLDRYGGSYNCRRMRGGSSWSTHAWGVAIDWYPSRNKLPWRSDRASLAHPDLDAWWELWESEGWLSLGRTEDRDWMHVQAARR